jgi:hypothetical protein
MNAYTHILDLAQKAAPPADGILSRTIFGQSYCRYLDTLSYH